VPAAQTDDAAQPDANSRTEAVSNPRQRPDSRASQAVLQAQVKRTPIVQGFSRSVRFDPRWGGFAEKAKLEDGRQGPNPKSIDTKVVQTTATDFKLMV